MVSISGVNFSWTTLYTPNMSPMERKSWWCWLAKEEKRQPRAATRPPMTAVRRVDLRRHTATVTGDASSDTHVHSEHSHTETEKERLGFVKTRVFKFRLPH